MPASRRTQPPIGIRTVLVWRLVGILLVGLCITDSIGPIFRGALEHGRDGAWRSGGVVGFIADTVSLLLSVATDQRWLSASLVPTIGLAAGLYLALGRLRLPLALTRRYLGRCPATTGSN